MLKKYFYRSNTHFFTVSCFATVVSLTFCLMLYSSLHNFSVIDKLIITPSPTPEKQLYIQYHLEKSQQHSKILFTGWFFNLTENQSDQILKEQKTHPPQTAHWIKANKQVKTKSKYINYMILLRTKEKIIVLPTAVVKCNVPNHIVSAMKSQSDFTELLDPWHLPNFMKNSSSPSCGFRSIVNIEKLPKGKYDILLMAQNNLNSLLIPTNETLTR